MSKTKNRQSDPDANVQLLVLASGGNFVIEIAAHWRVTFGFINPSQSGMHASRGDGHCLRVWEGEKLRAVFGNVRGFRDMSIPLAREVRKETGSSEWAHDSAGNFKESAKGKVERELVVDTDASPF